MYAIKRIFVLSLLSSVMLFGGWTEVEKMVGGSGDGTLDYGYSVAVDGDYMVIGAPVEYAGDGAVYIFKTDANNNWTPFQKIDNVVARVAKFNSYEFGGVGYDVDVVNNTIVIGAPSSTHSYRIDLGLGNPHWVHNDK